MENPWFGPKADIASTGIVAWQGWVAVVLGIGGAMVCHHVLKNDWAAAGCVAALVIAFILKYDPDAESY